jgi:hypothetical protein
VQLNLAKKALGSFKVAQQKRKTAFNQDTAGIKLAIQGCKQARTELSKLVETTKKDEKPVNTTAPANTNSTGKD